MVEVGGCHIGTTVIIVIVIVIISVGVVTTVRVPGVATTETACDDSHHDGHRPKNHILLVW